jgi:hypothetical protein
MRILAPARRFACSPNYDIAPEDGMFGGNHDHYFGVGASASSNILHALAVLSWWAELVLLCSNLKLVTMSERAWDDHHDVITVQR